MTVQVASQPPGYAREAEVDPALLALFRAFMREEGVEGWEAANPYTHQSETFTHVLGGRQVALVAGTAAGKTLAIAVPLFHAVKTGRARKVAFVYPTRALLADQRRVLGQLAVASGLGESAIGEVRGGMTSAGLIQSMSKPIIVATPDALYWFFRKNVKFTMTLIYGLALADEIVLDEAHLYTGLMQRNMWHFVERLRQYRQAYLHQPLRVHYLTATANEALQAFSPGSVLIAGRSKCTDVTVHLRAVPRKERSQQLEATIAEALSAGGKRILVVANAARLAHGIFLGKRKEVRDATDRAAVPRWFWERFGLVRVDQALDVVRGIDPTLAKQVAGRLKDELSIRARDLERARVRLRAEYLAELACAAVERDQRQVGRLLDRYERRHGAAIDRGKLGVMLREHDVEEAARRLKVAPASRSSVADAREELDEQGSAITTALQQAIDRLDLVDEHGRHGGILLAGAVDAALGALLPADGLTEAMRKQILRWMARRLVIDRDTVESWEHMDEAVFGHRSLPVGRILRLIDEPGQRERAADLLIAGLAGHAGIGIAPSLPGEPLVILYTGSMARYTREGLIEGFGMATTDRAIVLISTSAVEVGVDFSADMLITEECEGSSFLQRLGRVGRRPKIRARTWVLVEPRTLEQLYDALGSRAEVPREQFAAAIYKHFPQRSYLAASTYVDALQAQVSQQVGRTGRRLAAATSTPEALELAAGIAEAGIEVEYGLRGTMPAVSLLDEGVSKDPFYILSFVGNEEILPAVTPFELAVVNKAFNALVFAPGWRRIHVDLKESLKRSLAVAVPGPKGAQIVSNLPDGGNPARLYSEACGMIEALGESGDDDAAEALAEEFPMLPSTACDAPELLLAYGPLVLGYYETADRDASGPVCDERGSRLTLPPQWYLVLRKATSVDEGWALAEGAGVLGFENEVHYDTDRPVTVRDPGIVLVDKQAGAVWEIWETLRGQGVRR